MATLFTSSGAWAQCIFSNCFDPKLGTQICITYDWTIDADNFLCFVDLFLMIISYYSMQLHLPRCAECSMTNYNYTHVNTHYTYNHNSIILNMDVRYYTCDTMCDNNMRYNMCNNRDVTPCSVINDDVHV